MCLIRFVWILLVVGCISFQSWAKETTVVACDASSPHLFHQEPILHSLNASVSVSAALEDVSFAQAKPTLGTAMASLDGGELVYFYSSNQKGQTYIASRVSRNGGHSWSAERQNIVLSDSKAMAPSVLKTKEGILHLFFIGYKKHEWHQGEPTDNDRSDLWTARSNDGGLTWSAPMMIYKGYTGSTNGALETDSGVLVVPFSHYVADPGRLVARVATSQNGGRSWSLGSYIDIGGAGDHDGAMEPTVVDIESNRLLMLFRTTRGYLWQATSDDWGAHWGNIKATSITSAEAPANIGKTSDGRMFVVWNPQIVSGTFPLTQNAQSRIARMLSGRKQLRLSEFFLDKHQNIQLGGSFVVAQGAQVTYPTVMQAGSDLWIAFQDVALGWRQVRAVITKVNQYPCVLR